MAIVRERLPCPFCEATEFHLSAFVNDDFEPGDPDTQKTFSVSCATCHRALLILEQRMSGETQVRGVSECLRCGEKRRVAMSKVATPTVSDFAPWRALQPADVSVCPECGGELVDSWWTWSAGLPKPF